MLLFENFKAAGAVSHMSVVHVNCRSYKRKGKLKETARAHGTRLKINKKKIARAKNTLIRMQTFEYKDDKKISCC